MGRGWNGRACWAKINVASTVGGTELSVKRISRYSSMQEVSEMDLCKSREGGERQLGEQCDSGKNTSPRFRGLDQRRLRLVVLFLCLGHGRRCKPNGFVDLSRWLSGSCVIRWSPLFLRRLEHKTSLPSHYPRVVVSVRSTFLDFQVEVIANW